MRSRNLETENPSPNISALAESLYKLNHHEAIKFEIDTIKQISDLLSVLYPTASIQENKKMKEILNIWFLAKFCHYAENVAAYALCFLISYEDEKDEIRGVFEKIIKYNMGQIIDFFTHIEKRDETYVSEFIGFPPLDTQNNDTRFILSESCKTIKEVMINIGRNYKELYGFHMAYKHGYRVIPGKLNGSSDVITYIESDGSQKYLEVNENDIQEISKLSRDCSMILDCIFENHHERILFESLDSKARVQIQTIMKGKPTHKKENLSILYPTRGERKKEEELQADNIYADLFNSDMETKHQGKIVAIDFDNKKIVSLDYDPKVVFEHVHNYEFSGRIRIRRVGKNKSIGIKIW